MRNYVLPNNQDNPVMTPDETLKATSLLYLQDALEKEQFEQCPELIEAAKGFGAKQNEISELIAEYVREVTAGRQNAARKAFDGNRRF